ncbi:uncharacterized protein EV154DRAFT_503041 [Mucor mucedo]|uniref:uncharacterized protein n=1 Tax=Mucor mucedo TaxID=29922 RepID=UPI002220AD42|nr:uncharacterized protein EV154DRAFT_503041 [Mucor mucedo]KAI7893034.1 hypothetical protein EV154DRAFT_503041 [Mucor mucedo]
MEMLYPVSLDLVNTLLLLVMLYLLHLTVLFHRLYVPVMAYLLSPCLMLTLDSETLLATTKVLVLTLLALETYCLSVHLVNSLSSLALASMVLSLEVSLSLLFPLPMLPFLTEAY